MRGMIILTILFVTWVTCTTPKEPEWTPVVEKPYVPEIDTSTPYLKTDTGEYKTPKHHDLGVPVYF